MAVWNCGAESCRGHSNASDRCSSGSWNCGRLRPACPGHAHPSDRCASTGAWSCRAEGCPGHSHANHRCASGRWTCGRTRPRCAGHSAPNRQCRGDLTHSREDCGCASDTLPASGTCQPCPLTEEIRVVEIHEVIVQGSSRTRRPAASRHQFVNLDNNVDSGTSHPEFGRCIKLQARIEWVSGDRARSLQGKTVYWYIRSGSGNKSGLSSNDQENFNSVGSGVKRRTTTTDRQGWTTVVEFYLSTYGGDSFDVFATENSAYTGGVSAGPYEVWKKFWYQVTEMRDGSGGVYNVPAGVTTAFERGYESAKIELEEKVPSGGRRRSTHRSFLENATARRNEASPHFQSDSFCPFKAHIMTLDYSGFGPQNENITGTMNSANWVSANWKLLWRHGSGTFPWKVSGQYRVTGPTRWYCRRSNPSCPGHSSHTHRCGHNAGNRWTCGARGCPSHSEPSHRCVDRAFECKRRTPACPGHSSQSHNCASPSGAVWDCGATGCSGHPSPSDVCSSPRGWQDIPDSAISLRTDPSRRGFKKIVLNFGSGPVTPTSTNQVEIRFEVKTARGPALGWGGGSHFIYLCTGALRDYYSSSDWVSVQRSDLVHELGHALGLVNMAPTSSGAHSAWEDTSHPNHCQKPGPQCTMYYGSSTSRATTFHIQGGTGCQDHLRKQDFSRSVMSGQWT